MGYRVLHDPYVRARKTSASGSESNRLDHYCRAQFAGFLFERDSPEREPGLRLFENSLRWLLCRSNSSGQTEFRSSVFHRAVDWRNGSRLRFWTDPSNGIET